MQAPLFLPAQASSTAAEVDAVMAVTFWVTAAFFGLVVGVLGTALVRFRHRGDGDRRVVRPVRGSWRHEVIYAAVPGTFLIGLLVLSEWSWARIWTREKPADALRVDVLAQQFAWNFRTSGPDGKFGATDLTQASESNPFGLVSADPAGKDDVVQINEVTLPAGRPVCLLLRSLDVIHGFYVPEFRTQQNVLPGRTLELWITPSRAGSFEIVCNQFCGLAHYRMKASLTVE